MTDFENDPNYQEVLASIKNYYAQYVNVVRSLDGGSVVDTSYKRPVSENSFPDTAPENEALDRLKAVVKEKLDQLDGFSVSRTFDDAPSLDVILKEALKNIQEEQILALKQEYVEAVNQGLFDPAVARELYLLNVSRIRHHIAIGSLIEARQLDFNKNEAATWLSKSLLSENPAIDNDALNLKIASIIENADQLVKGDNVEDLLGQLENENSLAILQYYDDRLKVHRELSALRKADSSYLNRIDYLSSALYSRRVNLVNQRDFEANRPAVIKVMDAVIGNVKEAIDRINVEEIYRQVREAELPSVEFPKLPDVEFPKLPKFELPEIDTKFGDHINQLGNKVKLGMRDVGEVVNQRKQEIGSGLALAAVALCVYKGARKLLQGRSSKPDEKQDKPGGITGKR